MIDKPSTRDCFACGARDTSLVFAQRFAMIEGVSILDGYDVVECVRCGACYADGIPPQAQFDAYYELASKYELPSRNPELPAPMRERYGVEIDALSKHLHDRGARVLEVGCATGGLLAMLRERGYRDVRGFDPSPACAEIGRDVRKLDIRAGSLFSLAEEYRDIDALLAIGVIEHLRDLADALAKMRAVLAPSGLLFLELPDGERFHDYPDAPYQEFSVEHINYFSRDSLATLLEASGFETVDIEQGVRAHAGGAPDPVLSGFFRRTETKAKPQPSRGLAPALSSYVRGCAERERPMLALAEEVANDGRPLVIWGCGTLTLRLLATSALGRANIQAFTDSNARYWGRTLHGRPIVEPAAVELGASTLLVSSIGQRDLIADAARRRFGPNVPLAFYPAPT